LIGRTVREDIEDKNDKVIVEEGTVVDAAVAKKLAAANIKQVPIIPFVTADMEYLNADAEDHYVVAQANAVLNDNNEFVNDRVSARHKQGFIISPVQKNRLYGYCASSSCGY
jgi:DNA-directed RNA polymerase beta subunit